MQQTRLPVSLRLMCQNLDRKQRRHIRRDPAFESTGMHGDAKVNIAVIVRGSRGKAPAQPDGNDTVAAPEVLDDGPQVAQLHSGGQSIETRIMRHGYRW